MARFERRALDVWKGRKTFNLVDNGRRKKFSCDTCMMYRLFIFYDILG